MKELWKRNEVNTSNLSKKEFRVMILKMVKDLEEEWMHRARR